MNINKNFVINYSNCNLFTNKTLFNDRIKIRDNEA